MGVSGALSKMPSLITSQCSIMPSALTRSTATPLNVSSSKIRRFPRRYAVERSERIVVLCTRRLGQLLPHPSSSSNPTCAVSRAQSLQPVRRGLSLSISSHSTRRCDPPRISLALAPHRSHLFAIRRILSAAMSAPSADVCRLQGCNTGSVNEGIMDNTPPRETRLSRHLQG